MLVFKYHLIYIGTLCLLFIDSEKLKDKQFWS